MRGEIIAIGDELTSGRILNTTSYFAAAQLFAAGHEVLAMTTVGDDSVMIGKTLRHALARVDFVIVTGGLGPTSDDLTTDAVADALHRPKQFYPEILRKIGDNSWMGEVGSKTSLEKLAWLPAGAHELHTEAKTAGYFLVQEGKPIFLLPGVPHEMKELFIETVISRLAVWEDDRLRPVRQKVYKVTGLTETEINRRLDHIDANDSSVRLGYYPVFPEVHVSLTVCCDSKDALQQKCTWIDGQVREILGDALYGEGDDTLETVVGRLLAKQGKTLAVAESCSGGLIAHRLTRVAGISEFFVGGFVAYSNDMKVRLLGVDHDLLKQHGAVSEMTAQAMATGARLTGQVDLAVAVTGIAGPSGGSAEKPVGTVYFGLASDRQVVALRRQFGGNRQQVQEQTAQTALDIVRRALLGRELT